MFYEGKNPILQIIGVERIAWSSGLFHVAPRSYCALALRTRGTTVITVREEKYYVNPGDILYMPQNLAYTAEYSDTEMVVIHFLTQNNDPCPELYTTENAQPICEAFLRAHSLWQERPQGCGVYGLSQLYYILGLICDREAKAKLPPCFLTALSYIHGNFKDHDLSVERICKQAGIGQTNFRSLFQAHYQTTPIAYITGLRLEHARNLIASSVSIETAAVQSGFNDPKYFARTVRKHFGCTPRQLKDYGK